MESTLLKINDIVQEYESGKWQSTDNLRKLLRELTTANYHLSKFNIEYFQQYNAIQHNFNGSVSASKIKAENDIPELRITRKIMDATDNVIWSMRSELSIIKNED